MNPHLSDEALDDLLIGLGTSEDEEHLAHCAHCRARVEAFQGDMALLRQTTLDWSRVRAAALPSPIKAGIRHWHLSKMGWAAVSLLLLVLVTPVMQHRTRESSRPAPALARQEAESEQQIAQDNALMQAVDTALNSDDAAPARAYHLSDRSQRRQKARLDEN